MSFSDISSPLRSPQMLGLLLIAGAMFFFRDQIKARISPDREVKE